MSRVRGILFDLDGTLVDSESLQANVVQAMAAELGAPVSFDLAMEITLGKAWQLIAAGLHEAISDTVTCDLADLERNLIKGYEQITHSTHSLIDTSVAMLKRIAHYAPIGIVSGSTRGQIAEWMDIAGITDMVSFIIGKEDYTESKPSPEPYIVAAQKAGILAGECLVFEDSAAGVQSALAAGMQVVALKRPDAPQQDVSGAQLVVSDLTQVAMMFNGAMAKQADKH